MTRILLLGVSTRALAQSAVRAGHDVVAVDFFGDRDQVAVCESFALGRDLGLPLTAEGLAASVERVEADAVVYGSNLDNHPEIVRRLAESVDVLGNGAAAVGRVREWASLRCVCVEHGLRAPETLLPGEESHATAGRRWLRKRRRSGGGHGVGRWRGEALDANHLLQAEVDGRPASVVFVADGRKARVLGVTEQLVGRHELGARGYCWCGNVLPLETPASEAPSVRRQARRMADVLTREYGLRGLNGLDCMVTVDAHGASSLWLIEVNPRFTGSMELVERALGVDLFDLHLAGCHGRLPTTLPRAASPRFHAKGVVYARQAARRPDTRSWIDRGRRDVPGDGQDVLPGHPVCTVFSTATNRGACLELLWCEAAEVYADIGPRVADRTRAADPGRPPRTGDAGVTALAADLATDVKTAALVRTLVRNGASSMRTTARDIEEVV